MLGDFITRCLILLFGYTYPAFECFRTVEKNRADIEQLRFWCQYWVIVAVITVFERFADILISWVPMYGEMKLAFFIYLWHPKTMGTSYVYEVFLRPYVSRHEPDIDRKLSEMRARAWDVALLYWESFASQGQAKFFEVLRYLAAQSYKPSPDSAQKTPLSFNHDPPRQQEPQKEPTSGPPPPPPILIRRPTFQSFKAERTRETPSKDRIHMTPRQSIATEQDGVPASPVTPVPTPSSTKTNSPMLGSADETLHAARLRLRRQQRTE